MNMFGCIYTFWLRFCDEVVKAHVGKAHSMPKRRKSTALVRSRRVHRGRRAVYGGSLRSWLGKAKRFLKRTKLISRSGNVLGKLGVPYAGTIGKIAGVVGYGARGGSLGRGRRVRVVRRGRGLGGALRLAGAGKKRLAHRPLPISY